MVGFRDLVGTGIAPVSKKTAVKGHFLSVAKVALRFGCAKQSKNLEWYLMCISLTFHSKVYHCNQ
jgi:hypothetical protein